MIIERIPWKEYHENGVLHMDGEIGIVAELWKHLYDYRTQVKGYEGKAVVRLGIWTNYYDNGQIWWQIDFCESRYDDKTIPQIFPSYRKDGTVISH